jgi:hypothetical protein
MNLSNQEAPQDPETPPDTLTIETAEEVGTGDGLV